MTCFAEFGRRFDTIPAKLVMAAAAPASASHALSAATSCAPH